jgi:hypothetical protein
MGLQLTPEELDRQKKHLATCRKLGVGKEASPERMDDIRNRVLKGQSVSQVIRDTHCAANLVYRVRKELGMI